MLPGRLLFLLQFSEKGGQSTLVGRIVLIFVAKIEIEAEPLQIVIVAVCRNLVLYQPPKIGVNCVGMSSMGYILIPYNATMVVLCGQ